MKLIMNKCTINKKSVDSINYLGYNYIKVRDLADILGLEVSFDTETKEVTLGPGKWVDAYNTTTPEGQL